MASAIILAKSSLNTTTFINYGPHYGSILQQSRITYKEFIKILAHFSNGLSVKTAAEQANLAENTVRRFCTMRRGFIFNLLMTYPYSITI